MAFFRYSTLTRELLEISDIPISPGDNEAISEIENISKSELSLCQWDSDSCIFINKSPRKISKREFLKRITPLEYSTIKNAATSNAIIDYYWQLFMIAEFIDLSDQDVILGISAIENMGIIQPGRAMEILV